MRGLNERALEIARATDAPGQRTNRVRLTPAPGATDERVLEEYRRLRERRAERTGSGEAPRTRRPRIDVREFVASL